MKARTPPGPEFGQRLDEEVVVDRAREKPLAGFEVRAIDHREVAERHVRDGNVEGVVAERRVLKADAVDGGPRIQRFEQAGGQGVQLDGGADRPGRDVCGLQAEEAPDASGGLQDPRSGKIAEPQREQAIPDSPDHVRTGEERVQTRALKRLPLAVVHQGPKTVSALDPGVVLRPVSAQSERRLEGAVAEAAEARQDCALLGGGWATLSRQGLEETSAARLASKRAAGPTTKSAGVQTWSSAPGSSEEPETREPRRGVRRSAPARRRQKAAHRAGLRLW